MFCLEKACIPMPVSFGIQYINILEDSFCVFYLTLTTWPLTVDVASSGSADTLKRWLSPLAFSPWCRTWYRASSGTLALMAPSGMSVGTGGEGEWSSMMSGLLQTIKKTWICHQKHEYVKAFIQLIKGQPKILRKKNWGKGGNSHSYNQHSNLFLQC